MGYYVGIHLNVYAIDRDPFDRLIDKSLAELLWLHQATALPSNRVLLFIAPDGKDTTYDSVLGKNVTVSFTDSENVRQRAVLSKSDAEGIPFLAQSARAFMDDGCAFSLLFFLRGFNGCSGLDFLHAVEMPDRRWWIGSVLHYGRDAFADPSEYDELVLLFRRILRGWNCGADMPEGDVGIRPEMPIRLDDEDPNLRAGFWTKTETEWLLDRMEFLLATDIEFGKPPDSPDMYPDTPDECDSWVRRHMRSIVDIRLLHFNQVNVLTTIG